jgi:ABC-2 type transport system permease protein
MVGKVAPYIGIGAVQVIVVLVASKLLFAVPFIGAMPLLLAAILLFIVALVLLGYTISTFARTQMQAMQLTFFLFLPSMLLSGFMFPFRGMPDWAQTIGEILPLTHFLRIIRGIMLKGAGPADIASELMALAVFAVIFALAALLRFRRTLD